MSPSWPAFTPPTCERREAAGRDDPHSAAFARSRPACASGPHAWGARPVLLYGFDDLTEEQLELVAALAGACQVTVAVNYEDREALAARAGLLARLRDELGGRGGERARLRRRATPRAPPCATSTGTCSRPAPTRVEPDDGIAMLECGGERGRGRGGRRRGRPAARRPESRRTTSRSSCGIPSRHGPLYAQVFEGFGIPVAVEARCRWLEPPPAAASPRWRARACPRAARGAAGLHARPAGRSRRGSRDWVERGTCSAARRRTADAADRRAGRGRPAMLAATSRRPPRRRAGCVRWRRRRTSSPRRRTQAASRSRAIRTSHGEGQAVPFAPLELRAAAAAAVGRSDGARRAGGDARLRGPLPDRGAGAARGRSRSAVARADRGKGPGAEPLPGAGRPRPPPVRRPRSRTASSPAATPGTRCSATSGARRLGIPALVRQDPATRGALPLPRLRLPPDRAPVALLAKLRRGGPPGDPVAVRGRRPRPARPGARGGRGEAEAGPRPGPRRLRAHGGARRPRAGALPGRSRAAAWSELPGPLADPGVLAELARRDPVGPGTIEKWIECPYRWFVDHELKPQRLEPQPDHLTAGSIVHEVLERLYSEPPGDDAIPRPGDLERWRERAADTARGGGRAAGAAARPAPDQDPDRPHAGADRAPAGPRGRRRDRAAAGAARGVVRRRGATTTGAVARPR